MYISYVNTEAKAHLFTAVFSQLTIFTAHCLRHPIQMPGIETIWELHTLTVINFWYTATVKRFWLLQLHFGHLICIPFVCMTHKVQGMLSDSN